MLYLFARYIQSSIYAQTMIEWERIVQNITCSSIYIKLFDWFFVPLVEMYKMMFEYFALFVRCTCMFSNAVCIYPHCTCSSSQSNRERNMSATQNIHTCIYTVRGDEKAPNNRFKCYNYVTFLCEIWLRKCSVLSAFQVFMVEIGRIFSDKIFKCLFFLLETIM